MCGIAGFSGAFQPALLGKMSASIAHRGPDDDGEFYDRDARLGLAHRRLSIIDLSARGRQPLWDATGTVCIVFNGEIFNYRELRRELERDGFAFRSNADTEVIVNLYLKRGDAALARLNGMFAFALWDTRTKTLLIARDGVGVKPLYYSELPQGVVFASELKALLHCTAIERNIDHHAVCDYLTYLWCPAPRTMLRAVKKLEPGAALRVVDGRVASRFDFYELPFDQTISTMPAADASRLVREHVQQAVDRQMMSDVPVGALLSGGLDSSAVVACAMKSRHDNPLDCYTIGFLDAAYRSEGNADDLPFAQQVSRDLGARLHTVTVGAKNVADEMQRMIAALDEPQADFAPINAYLMCRLAREHGVKVLLSGTGGDDVFSGYRRHRALDLERWWQWLPACARRGLRGAALALPASPTWMRRATRAFWHADLDSDTRLASYFQRLAPAALQPILGDAVLAHLQDYSASAPLMGSLARMPAHVPPMNRMLYLECRHFVPDHNLNYLDKMSMATGVEVRVPLLDPDLIALVARLPSRYKQRGRVGKWIFKQAMQPLLPRTIVHRRKSSFGAPVRHWLHNELRHFAEDTLSGASIRHRGLFNPAAVQKLLKLDRAGAVDASYTLLSLVCIEFWCRLFVDAPTPPDVSSSAA